VVNRIYVEKRKGFDDGNSLLEEIKNLLGIRMKSVRRLIRYDIEGLDAEQLTKAIAGVFSEPMVDTVHGEIVPEGMKLVVEFLDGQYDQRADSAMQCVQLLLGGVRPLVKCADVYAFDGLSAKDFAAVKKYLINPVDSKEGSFDLPATLRRPPVKQRAMRTEIDLTAKSEAELRDFYARFGFAMSIDDLRFVRDYFKLTERRNPTHTEVKVIDTYWSDHCRHTTFLTEIKDVKILSKNPHIRAALDKYQAAFKKLYKKRADKYMCLMDIATIAAKLLKAEGLLGDLDESEEINACSVKAVVDVDGRDEEWLLMFKNETHNHPTEIEPYGGAATCLGGAIRDPLSGRAYVYQAMRVTGAGNPLADMSETLPGKLPQRVLTKTALKGFSSYGNQIGLATGIVEEIYHDGYRAKRLETGYVVGANKAENVRRQTPKPGDVVLLVGGDTGRDGCGGATGSSKAHNAESVGTLGAEVQKGNPPEERKLQRLFRNPAAARLVIKCNDFGAGGVAVAIGELSPGLCIYLDRIRKKYEGLNATELAISESQERMAVVLERESVEAFVALCEDENLNATLVAEVTDNDRLVMRYGAETIVDIARAFLDTNGVKQETDAHIFDDYKGFLRAPEPSTGNYLFAGDLDGAVKNELSRLNVCSKKGMGETFDSTIGAATVLMPFGGRTQLTPAVVMAAKPPADGLTHTVTCSSFALYPHLMSQSPFTGAVYAIVSSVSKLVASGVRYDSIRLSLQEFFKRLGGNPARWGEPLSALLGAFAAQTGLKLPAIGGKDSMSGTFEKLDVPPTLISFAFGLNDDRNIIHNVFEKPGMIYRFSIPRDNWDMPKFPKLAAMYREIERLIKDKRIVQAAVVEEGGMLAAVVKSALGNMTGVRLHYDRELFQAAYGDILAVSYAPVKSEYARQVGSVNDSGWLEFPGYKTELKQLVSPLTSTLEPIYPTTAAAVGSASAAGYAGTKIYVSGHKFAAPTVFIPVFPGTNCEYDTARAFERAGAKADIFVVKNRTPQDIEDSIAEMKRRIDQAQIIAFPGGFSGGDEPDGSGKFIAATFRNPALADAVEAHLYRRDGLILGICNGFQALVKLGLLPGGHIERRMTEKSPTLTFNNLRRHVSTIVRVRVGTTRSPWLSEVRMGDIFSVPVSHGEGKFVIGGLQLDQLNKLGQIATQYIDEQGHVTMKSPFNPNGSTAAIEGIISADGRIYGKMGHTERYAPGLYQNVPGNFEMPIFSAGVDYFK
jgi:phosphoribosylformylglycinamidine synthase